MQKNWFTVFTLALTLLCATVVSAQNNAAPAAADKAAAPKIIQFLEGSGHGYTKAQDGVWVVKFKGNHLPDITVIVIHSEGLLVLASPLAEKAEFKAAPELLQKLLRFNDDFDRVKVGIDKDGDVLVRVEFALRLADQNEFNANLEHISSAADLTFEAIKPFLLAPKKTGK